MFSQGYKLIDEIKDDKRLNIEQLRKIDPAVSGLNDEELGKLRQSYYDLVQLMYENWYEEKFSSKNPVGLLTEK